MYIANETGRQTRGRWGLLAAALALGMLAAAGDAGAQTPQPRDAPLPTTGEVPQSATPRGARYYPGIGFRLAPPLDYTYGYRARVYGYYADRESMRYYRGYRARRVACERDWLGDRCRRRWH